MGRLKDVRSATRAYEAWLATHTRLVATDLRRKHEETATSPFIFLRATYYLWAARWPVAQPDFQKAPRVTAIGDLHVENFGTWRDAEGRLAWGINDFDEAAQLPYANDLVRLVTSALLAAREERITLTEKAIARAVLEGYSRALKQGGAPILLAEGNRRLGERVLDALIEPRRFWRKMVTGLKSRPKPPHSCLTALADGLPAGVRDVAIHARVAGLGSLGRPRFVAIGEWHGGHVAREAKAFAPSAALWASGTKPPDPLTEHAAHLIARAVRSPDPYLHLAHGWIVRRLAPDTGKIRIVSLGDPALELRLLELMGAESANVHLATRGMRRAILKDLGRREAGWLRRAARRMAEDMEEQYGEWSSRSR
jgi:hypothetical protein